MMAWLYGWAMALPWPPRAAALARSASMIRA
jgi:hypothetical protein